MASTSIDGVGEEEECNIGEKEVIPALLPSSAMPDVRPSTSTIDILLVGFFLTLSS